MGGVTVQALILCFSFLLSSCSNNLTETLNSPGKLTTVKISSDKEGELILSVNQGDIKTEIRLGLEYDGRSDVFSKPVSLVNDGKLNSENHLDAINYFLNFESGAKIELLLFDEAIAFRYHIPEQLSVHIDKELTSFSLPSKTDVWFFERNNPWKLKSHAGEWISADISKMPSISSMGPTQGLPLVFHYPNSTYGFIAESDLIGYSGLRLTAVGNNTFQTDFTEGDKGFEWNRRPFTPWRILFYADNLNDLVNQKITFALATPMDKNLFDDTSWIIPGKAIWRFGTLGIGNPEEGKSMVDYAVALNAKYILVDDGWEFWPDKWIRLSEICEYAEKKDIGVWAWKQSTELSDTCENYGVMNLFMDSLKLAGICGIKIDFMDSEAKQWIDFDIKALETAAKKRLMVYFHGCQKPSAEFITYPNEMTREGIRGMELNFHPEGPITASHNASLPFTHLLLGPGDYTPLSFTAPGTTTWAHQLATLVCMYSPFQCLFEDPHVILNNDLIKPSVGFIRDIPVTWDEVRVLPPSEIGGLAILAKRSEDVWYVGGMNGAGKKVITLSLDFLSDLTYKMEIFLDDLGASPVPANITSPRALPESVKSTIPFKREKSDVLKTSSRNIQLAKGGGFAIKITPK